MLQNLTENSTTTAMTTLILIQTSTISIVKSTTSVISQQDPCQTNPCLNGATCFRSKSANIAQATCLCQPGFTGFLCETQARSACDSNPCQNDGTCLTMRDFSFECFCSSRFSGSLCQKKSPLPTNCMARPCKNNGTCLVMFQLYSVCLCQPGFNGEACENKSDFLFF